MANHNQLGKKGEQIAVKYLKEKGYQIMATNWHEHKFEIDIIAIDKDEIVFVEVKTRSSSLFGNPEESVTIKKQAHLIDGADYYLQKNEINLEARFDIISLVKTSKIFNLKHIKDAFSATF